MKRWSNIILSVAAIGLLFAGGVTYAEDDEEESSEFLIDRALWSSGNPRLYLKIKAKKTQIIQVENAYDSGQVLLREQQRSPCPIPNPSPVEFAQSTKQPVKSENGMLRIGARIPSRPTVLHKTAQIPRQ
jgi:hypothetical protein